MIHARAFIMRVNNSVVITFIQCFSKLVYFLDLFTFLYLQIVRIRQNNFCDQIIHVMCFYPILKYTLF